MQSMLFGVVLIFSKGCALPTNRPPIDWFKGDHKTQSIVGPKKKKSIFSKHQRLYAKQPEFDNYVALHKEDFKSLIKYIIELERRFNYVRAE